MSLSKETLEEAKKSVEVMTIEQVAMICHEANRAYCASIGDYSQDTWENSPPWQRESTINGVKFNLKCYPIIQPEKSHNNWLAEKIATGWIYGPVKDPEKKEHPYMVDYKDLSASQRIKDHIFCSIVNACYLYTKKD